MLINPVRVAFLAVWHRDLLMNQLTESFSPPDRKRTLIHLADVIDLEAARQERGDAYSEAALRLRRAARTRR